MKNEMTTRLNETELKVLVGLCDECIVEANEDLNEFPRTGWAGTAFDNAVRSTKLSMNSVKGYVTQLVQKGYIQIDTMDGDKYITLLEKCGNVMRCRVENAR